jgi:uncharacterized protein
MRPDAIAETQRWLERAVIGLNLCPFAKAVHTKGQIRWVQSAARAPELLLQELVAEMQHLVATPADITDTTLLIAPHALPDFHDFNDFLGVAEDQLAELGFEGVLQLASFHPRYRFADEPEGDIANCTNRSPHPTLHLLREDSVSRAVAAVPDADTIVERNIATLRRLGLAGWQRLLR